MSKFKQLILVSLFLATALIGGVTHSLDRGNGYVGGTVYYSHDYGRAYSWESGYYALNGFWKGSYHENRCGSLSIGTYEWDSRKPSESNKYIYSENCGMLMSLADLVGRYLNGTTVGELEIRHSVPDEGAQIALFNTWKSRGLFDDIRYKEVIIYDWGNIRSFVVLVLVIPLIVTFVAWLLITFLKLKLSK